MGNDNSVQRLDWTSWNGEKFYLDGDDVQKWFDIVDNAAGLRSVHSSGKRMLNTKPQVSETDYVYFKLTYGDGRIFELTGDESVNHMNTLHNALIFRQVRSGTSLHIPKFKKA